MIRTTLTTMLFAAALGACAGAEDDTAMDGMDDTAGEIALGPVDGLDLPPVDVDRIQVGDVAPDFTLVSREGEPVTLSSFRGSANVVLVFYRGHW